MDFKEALQNIKNDMIEREKVFEAVRRGYSELENATDSEILEYFSVASADELKGHISNIKGILFEQEVQDKLTANGIDSKIFETTNHPDTDLQIIEDGMVIEELQLKATESTSYINSTLAENPDISVVATTEVANSIGKEEVIDSGISDVLLEETIAETISPIPISVKGLLISVGLAALTGGLLGW